jgi:glucose/arabinose dehydrogenase
MHERRPTGPSPTGRHRAPRSTTVVLGALVVACLVAVGCVASSGAPVSVVPPRALTDIGSGLTGPTGMRAGVVAEGLADVSGLVLDTDGRIWAATAAFEDDGTDGVYLLDAAGGAPTEVITDIHGPMGLVWLDGWLYVASTGRVDAFGSFDGTAFAEHRTVLELPDGIGQSNGLVAGPDGRLSLGISAPCDSCDPASDLSGSIVSFLPDGTDLRVDVADVRAPIGLAYYPGTDDLFATVNQRDDLGEATPGDLLAQVAAGQSWGFPSCTGFGAVAGTSASACAAVPAPVAELDTHAAVSGLTFATGQFGSDVGTAALVAEWATGAVKRVTLTATGDGYAGSVADFIGGLQHPVPVLVAPDGSLLIGDWGTGTVYRITPA